MTILRPNILKEPIKSLKIVVYLIEFRICRNSNFEFNFSGGKSLPKKAQHQKFFDEHYLRNSFFKDIVNGTN